MVPVAAFSSPAHAHIVRGYLESEGIESRIADEHIVSVDWLYSNAVGGVKLLVSEADAERTCELLRERSKTSADEMVEFRNVAGRGDCCPACDSDDVAPSHLTTRMKALTMYVTVATLLLIPFILWGDEWSCRSCGHSWKPDAGTDA